jgi:hypothetical protein
LNTDPTGNLSVSTAKVIISSGTSSLLAFCEPLLFGTSSFSLPSLLGFISGLAEIFLLPPTRLSVAGSLLGGRG